jgi:hypothetical protein
MCAVACLQWLSNTKLMLNSATAAAVGCHGWRFVCGLTNRLTLACVCRAAVCRLAPVCNARTCWTVESLAVTLCMCQHLHACRLSLLGCLADCCLGRAPLLPLIICMRYKRMGGHACLTAHAWTYAAAAACPGSGKRLPTSITAAAGVWQGGGTCNAAKRTLYVAVFYECLCFY